ncbi:MAG: anti-sigma factor [Anaerolineae bacterium]
MTCEALREVLVDYVSEGEPVGAGYDSLRAHLQLCSACAQDLIYLRRVEQALRAWPLEQVSIPLRDRLLSTLDQRQESQGEPSQPWSIWLPALTVSVAIALALLLSPVPLSVSLEGSAAGPELNSLAPALNREALQAIMVGIATALAGIGVTTALAQGGLPSQDDVDALRDRATHAVAHFLRLAGHSH